MSKELDNYAWHEVLDRAAMIEGIFNDYVVGHPVVEANERLRAHVDMAAVHLSQVYQWIGGHAPHMKGEK